MSINALGIRMYITYPFAAVIALALLFDATGQTACCLLAAILHELGHIIMLKIFKSKRIDINLSALDFKIIDSDEKSRSYIQDISISVAGPLINFLLFFLFFRFDSTKTFAIANLVIGVFNIIPIDSLDGGKILMSFLITKLPQRVCVIICSVISLMFILPLAVLGFYILIDTGYNFSLIIICCYLITLMIFKKG